MNVNKKILKFQKKLRKILKKAQTKKSEGPVGECKFITNQIWINSFIWGSDKSLMFEIRGFVNDAYGKKSQDIAWRCFYADSYLLDSSVANDLVARLPGELLKSLANTAQHSISKDRELP